MEEREEKGRRGETSDHQESEGRQIDQEQEEIEVCLEIAERVIVVMKEIKDNID